MSDPDRHEIENIEYLNSLECVEEIKEIKEIKKEVTTKEEQNHKKLKIIKRYQ